MSNTDIDTLKGALLDQQKLLQKLYSELDVEREASATAASEALSMILRLQEEKAVVEMEASQYKRLAEAKMCHAEHSLEMFKELIHHKEMEIASLGFQVQAYRYKLLSMGWNDVGFNENRFPENLFRCRSGLSNKEIGYTPKVRRMSSLPIHWRDGYQKKGILESSSDVLTSETIPIILEECFDKEINQDTFDMDKKYGNCSTAGGVDLYWEQIRKLDDRVREISQSKVYPREDNRYIKSYTICSSTSVPVEIKNYKNYLNDSSSFPMNVVQDIHEVPRDEDTYKTHVKERRKSISNADIDILSPHDKDQSVWIKRRLSSLNLEANPSRPVEIKKEVNAAEFQQGLQQMQQRIERLEKERITSGKTEIIREGLGEEVLNLLEEIREKLNSIQKDIICWKSKEEPMLDETPIVALREAMLHFWL